MKVRLPPKSQRGYTLVEILVVVAIIGVLSSAVLIGIGSRDTDRKLQADAERLMLVIEQARQTTVARNQIWGLKHDTVSYGFHWLDEATGDWNPVEGHPFQTRALRETVQLTVQGEGFTLDAPRAGGDPPQIIILPNREISPFTIRLFDDLSADIWTVESDGLSQASASKLQEGE